MIYLDSTLFVIAAIDKSSRGEIAGAIIEKLNNAKEKLGVTSLLTFDELVYVVKKRRGFELSLKAGEALLSTNVLLADVTLQIIGRALDVIRHERQKPRDAIHLATMKAYGIKEVVSEDSDFDRVSWIKRIELKEFLKSLHD